MSQTAKTYAQLAIVLILIKSAYYLMHPLVVQNPILLSVLSVTDVAVICFVYCKYANFTQQLRPTRKPLSCVTIVSIDEKVATKEKELVTVEY